MLAMDWDRSLLAPVTDSEALMQKYTQYSVLLAARTNVRLPKTCMQRLCVLWQPDTCVICVSFTGIANDILGCNDLA